MIKIHFIGDNNKPTSMDIHAGIIKSHNILGNSLMIEFKRSEKTGVIKGKKPVAESFMNWIWTKNVNDILNFKEVMAFLKSLDLHSNPAKTIIIQQEDNQQTLF